MRVILAARTHRGIGGCQSWNDTVAKELLRRGHEVMLLAAVEDNRKVWDTRADLVIVSQAQLWDGGWPCPTLNVSHGIIDMEKPMPGFDRYAFVSEECEEFWVGRCDVQYSMGEIIRQPIDLDFWKARGETCSAVLGEMACGSDAGHDGDHRWSSRTDRDGDTITIIPRYIYRHSYYGGLDWLPDLAKEMGYGFRHGRQKSNFACRDYIRGASLVISSGRGALEAMACGRPTIICDDRPYSGMGAMMQHHGGQVAQTNYSGRGGMIAEPVRVRAAIKQVLGWEHAWRSLIAHHAVADIVDQLLGVVDG